MAPYVLPSPGDVIGGKYRLNALVASGGMAAVFSGEHLTLGQQVAIKVMLPQGAQIEAAVERFMREAQAAARAETEHVTRVLDAGMLDSGLPFLVMEFLVGCDLGALLAQYGPLAHDEVVDLALEALEGLAHVHAAGIVHRDLKPSNLFLARKPDGSGILKLLDFGVSKCLVEYQDDRDKKITGNAIVGSPVYMSPEQVKSARSVDARSDIWSMGVVMYELITGAVPFDGDGVGEVLAQILDGEPRPMYAVRPGVPEGLEAVVMRCLSRPRERRYESVAELARALAPFARKSAEERIRRIEAILIHAPLRRGPISLGSLRVIRPTQVERISAIIVPPGERRDVGGSGAFALSRTHVDVDAAGSGARTRATRRERQRWAAAAGAVVMGLAMMATSIGFLRSSRSDAPHPNDLAVAAALVAIPDPATVPDPPAAAVDEELPLPVQAASDSAEVLPPKPPVVRRPLPAGRREVKVGELAPSPRDLASK